MKTLLVSLRSRRTLLLALALFALLAGLSLTAYAGSGLYLWVDTGDGGCGQFERCGEWCEFIPGQGMVGTGYICCVPQHAIGTDEWGNCIR